MLRKKNTTLRFRLKSLKLNRKVVFTIVAVGISPFFAQAAGSFVMALANNTLYYHGGDLAIGAKGIMTQFIIFFAMPIFGINQGSQPILGFNYGAKRYDRVRETLKYTVTAAAVISFIGWCFIRFFPQVPIWVFTGDWRMESELAGIIRAGLPIFGGAFLVVGVQFVMGFFFQAIGKAGVALVLNLLRQVILFVPLLLILPPRFGLQGIWYAGLLADVIAFLVTAAMFAYTVRVKLRNIAVRGDNFGKI